MKRAVVVGTVLASWVTSLLLSAGVAAQTPPEVPVELRHGFSGAFFTDMNHGYVFGGDAIIATDDGGATWRPVRIGGGIESTFFLNAQTFWVLYEGGALHTSADGGRTFAVQRLLFLDVTKGERSPICGALFFVTAHDGWSICGRSVLKTSDGGQSWSATLLPEPLGDGYHIHMVDMQSGIAISPLHAVIRTTDGGLTWVAVPDAPKLRQLTCTKGVFCAGLAGPNGPLLVSADGGQSWTDTHIPLQLPDRDEIWAILALGPGPVLAGGGDLGFSPRRDLAPYVGTRTPMPTGGPEQSILLSWNGSAWTRLAHSELRAFGGLYFVDAQDGWLIGMDENLIYKTTDGGQTLQFVPDYFRQIAALTPSPAPFVLPTPSP